jgi:hypothetical protein
LGTLLLPSLPKSTAGLPESLVECCELGPGRKELPRHQISDKDFALTEHGFGPKTVPDSSGRTLRHTPERFTL